MPRSELIWQEVKDRLNPRIIHTKNPEQFAQKIAKHSSRREFIPELIIIESSVNPLTEGFQMETYRGNKTIRYRENPPRRKKAEVIPHNLCEPTRQASQAARRAREENLLPSIYQIATSANAIASFLDETAGVSSNLGSWVSENRIAILKALNTAVKREDSVRAAIKNEFIKKGDPEPGIMVHYSPGFGDLITRRIHGDREQVLQVLNKSNNPAAIAPWPSSGK